ncbi:hypothetical protein R6258_03070 [Halomonas sp. HP20-15]|uniref:hypothetical protein n=1 Tax=Halomonas sp. HP20-15 TaxID=3085901 RepID=UPI002981E668|nr:hypothetical protein [Halomonas sp. HP20-15]MDW5375895.1 hypothetical protein [Halomonas sp. HP20-15]
MTEPEDRKNQYTNSPSVTSSSPGVTSQTPGSSTESKSGEDHDKGSSRQHEAKEKGRETVDKVRNAARMKAEGMFDEQKWMFADHVERTSTVLRQMAKGFEEQDQRYFSVYAHNIARCTDALSQRLREQDLGSLVNQVQRYSQRQPAIFLGGAIAAGFFLARFLNSSQQHNAANTSQAGNPGGPSGTTGYGTTSGTPNTSAY